MKIIFPSYDVSDASLAQIAKGVGYQFDESNPPSADELVAAIVSLSTERLDAAVKNAFFVEEKIKVQPVIDAGKQAEQNAAITAEAKLQQAKKEAGEEGAMETSK